MLLLFSGGNRTLKFALSWSQLHCSKCQKKIRKVSTLGGKQARLVHFPLECERSPRFPSMVMEDFLGLPFESMLCKTIAASTPHMQFIVVTEVGYIIVFTRRESYLTVGVSVLSSGRIYLYSDLNSENIVYLMYLSTSDI